MMTAWWSRRNHSTLSKCRPWEIFCWSSPCQIIACLRNGYEPPPLHPTSLAIPFRAAKSIDRKSTARCSRVCCFEAGSSKSPRYLVRCDTEVCLSGARNPSQATPTSWLSRLMGPHGLYWIKPIKEHVDHDPRQGAGGRSERSILSPCEEVKSQPGKGGGLSLRLCRTQT